MVLEKKNRVLDGCGGWLLNLCSDLAAILFFYFRGFSGSVETSDAAVLWPSPFCFCQLDKFIRHREPHLIIKVILREHNIAEKSGRDCSEF